MNVQPRRTMYTLAKTMVQDFGMPARFPEFLGRGLDGDDRANPMRVPVTLPLAARAVLGLMIGTASDRLPRMVREYARLPHLAPRTPYIEDAATLEAAIAWLLESPARCASVQSLTIYTAGGRLARITWRDLTNDRFGEAQRQSDEYVIRTALLEGPTLATLAEAVLMHMPAGSPRPT